MKLRAVHEGRKLKEAAANDTPLTNLRAWNVYEGLCQDEAVEFTEEP